MQVLPGVGARRLVRLTPSRSLTRRLGTEVGTTGLVVMGQCECYSLRPSAERSNDHGASQSQAVLNHQLSRFKAGSAPWGRLAITVPPAWSVHKPRKCDGFLPFFTDGRSAVFDENALPRSETSNDPRVMQKWRCCSMPSKEGAMILSMYHFGALVCRCIFGVTA